jgi:hypothetical protein
VVGELSAVRAKRSAQAVEFAGAVWDRGDVGGVCFHAKRASGELEAQLIDRRCEDLIERALLGCCAASAPLGTHTAVISKTAIKLTSRSMNGIMLIF